MLSFEIGIFWSLPVKSISETVKDSENLSTLKWTQKMALSILRPLMYFLILRLVLQKSLVPFSPVVSERFNCESLQRTTDAKLQQYLTWPLQLSSELCTWIVSHNWRTLFRGWGNPPKKEGHLGVWQLWMKNIKVVWHFALTWHPLSVNF